MPGFRAIAAAVLVVCGLCMPLRAQLANPVYTDDSPVARETLQRVGEFIAAENDVGAVRELQRLLDEHAERMTPSPGGDPNLFTSVRDRVHEMLLRTPRILERYRATEETRAKERLETGDAPGVERTRLLTSAGFEAALRVAQIRLESGHFEGARLTLEQLALHPDRVRGSQEAKAASSLMSQVAAYIDRETVWDLAAQWAQHAEEPAPQRKGVPRPPALAAPIIDFDTRAPRIESEGVPAKPLWTVPIEPEQLPGVDTPSVPPGMREPAPQYDLWVLPSVVGDSVYVNDGTYITARDRFTLQPRWATRPVSEYLSDDPYAARQSQMRPPEDVARVTVRGRLLIATMGLPISSDREGDPGTYAIDAATGQLLWMVYLPSLDPQLDGAVVRGGAMIEGDTVIIAARKVAQGRRMISYYLLGLSAADGSLRWIRPVASAGSLIWAARSDMRFSGALLHNGVVYCSDALGLIAAVEAASGRSLWVRRVPVSNIVPGMGAEMLMPWQYGSLIASGDSVYALAPDRSGMLELEASSGNVRARRSSSSLGDPLYLLGVGGRFAAVGRGSMIFGNLDAIAEGPVFRSSNFDSGLRGRAVVSGDSVAVPVVGGVAVINPAEPARHRLERLDELGNVLPLESQLLAIGPDSLHSYLTWNMAHDLLDKRMRADPSDPEPAITYAELAYRAGKHDGIAPAADRALAALERRAPGETTRASRRRLFAVLKEMVENTQAAWNGAGVSPAPGEAQTAPQRPRLSLSDLAAVVERLGRAAQNADDRVAHFLAMGRLREAENSPALAAEAYQRILSEPALAAATWQGPRSSLRGELEATRRVRELLVTFGPRAYAAFDAQAAEELAGLSATAGAEALEHLARRYPAAGAAARAWARAAELHRVGNRPRSAVAALREGLAVAEVATAAGSLSDQQLLGKLAGSLIAALRGGEQYFAAAQLLSRLKAKYPDLQLVDASGSNVAEAANDLGRRLAEADRLPRIGTTIQPQVQVITNWGVMPPRSRSRLGTAAEHVMMGSPTELKVGLWSALQNAEGATSPGRTQLQLVWSRNYEGRAPTVLRHDPDAVYLLWPPRQSRQGPSVEAINALDGSTIYRTPDLRTLFPADTKLERRIELLRNTIDTPLDGAVSMSGILTAFDGDVMVLVERTGRAAAFERRTGKLLWAKATPVNQTHDITLSDGILAVGGESTPESDPYALTGLSPVVALIDARTGEVVHRLADLKGQIRWLRIGQGANQQSVLIAGLAGEVASIDLASGKLNWTATGGPAFGSLDAWVFGDRIFLLDESRNLYLLNAATGLLPEQPLNTEDRLTGMGPIEGTRIGADRFAFATERGLCIFDRSGMLVGLDPLQDETGETTLLIPIPTQGNFVAVESTPRHAMEDRLTYTVHILGTDTGMLRASRALRLELPPRRLAVLDGRIVLSAGNITLVYEVPERDEGEAAGGR